MRKSKSNTEKIVTKRFKEALVQTGLAIRSQDKWKTGLLLRCFDIVIYSSFGVDGYKGNKRINPLI